jgi:hypothetical protein
MKRIIAAACLIAAATPAYATNWFLLNASEAACMTGAEIARRYNGNVPMTPYVLEQGLRQGNTFVSTSVIRWPSGAIEEVDVQDTSQRVMRFFTTRQTCEAKRDELLNAGELNNPQELK